uniref:ABC transporter permease n=1 Tax=Roseihalotalea indica TaxID=2867963 RepID=A0AA49GIU9_9BACT|nr:ABC transporter permease [Tunicatimonas sp. TK19036]
MLFNYLKIAFRNLQKNRVFSLINIVGVAIGMAGCLLILHYVRYEFSYDRFHPRANQIYRVTYHTYESGQETVASAAAVPAVGPAMKSNFPEVMEYARFVPFSGIITYHKPDGNSVVFRESKMQIATPSVLTMFNFPLIEGDTATALEGAFKAVLSESAAKRYFGNDDPLGKTLAWQDGESFQVTGVMKDVPANSHIKFDFLVSYETINKLSENQSETSWDWYDFNTYVLLDDQADSQEFQAKWDQWLAKERQEEWEKGNFHQAFVLQPLTDIHLYSHLVQESEPEEQGNGDAVYFLIIIAGFILLIAWINYVNLSTARAMERAGEVGVRKAVGAHKKQLITQFLLEAMLINFLASLISIILVTLALPYLVELTGRRVDIDLISQSSFWLTLLLLFLGGTMLSGFYPAVMLSSFDPVTVLKGKLHTSGRGIRLRKALVVFQFGTSVALIAGTLVVYQQLRFMLRQDLGVNIAQMVVLKGAGATDSTYENSLNTFKTEMLRNASISSVTAATNVPGDEIFWATGVQRLTGGPESSLTFYNVAIDYEYVPSFGLTMVAGRNFSTAFETDRNGALLNEAATRDLLYASPEEALGEQVRVGGDTLTVVGVMANYHQMALKYAQSPMVFRLNPAADNFYAIRVETADMQETLESIRQQWQASFPGNPFDYFFLDEFFNRQYQPDRLFGQVFTLFSGLAIFVACLGLFGLVSFTTVQRTKEIGVRKVLGASVNHIVSLLSQEFIRLIVLGSILAIPLAYWVIHRWLTTYPFRITVSWWFFLLSFVLVLLIAMITVSYQTTKAARANPVKSLRYE